MYDMTNKGKLISFRANEEDIEIIESYKKKTGEGVRKVTDADAIRFGLSLIGEKKYNKKNSDDVLHVGVVDVYKDDMVKRIAESVEGKDLSAMSGVRILHQSGSEIPPLTDRQKELGYHWYDGELLDKEGFPVSEMDGDVVTRGSSTFVKDPNREELREKGQEKMAEILVDTPMGTMNPAMAAVLGEKHSAPGMLTVQEGVDESPMEEVSQETDYL